MLEHNGCTLNKAKSILINREKKKLLFSFNFLLKAEAIRLAYYQNSWSSNYIYLISQLMNECRESFMSFMN